MAGGGDVRIIGRNSRVRGGVANVSDNCLHTKVCQPIEISNMENITTHVLSASTGGRAILIPTSPNTLIHTVPAGVIDRITLFCSNPNSSDDRLEVQWGLNGFELFFFLPAFETVSIVVDMPLEAAELVTADSAFATVRVFGRVDRVN